MRQRTMGRLGAILIAFTLVLPLLAACGGQAPAAPPTAAAPTAAAASAGQPAAAPAARVPAGTLTVATASLGTETLLPNDSLKSNKIYLDAIYDYLLYVDPVSLQPAPGLATSWKMSPDGKKFTFELRKDVKFHNGDDFTSADVKYTIGLLSAQDSKSTSGPSFRQWIDNVETPDASTVILNLKMPTTQLLSELSILSAAPMMPKNYIEQKTMDYAREHPVGTGPFKFVERQAGQYVKLEAVANHWRQTPHYKTVMLRMVREDATRLAMLKTGEADIMDMAMEQKPEVESAGMVLKRVPNSFAMSIFLMGQYKQDRPEYDPKNPFLKKEVRQALNFAIDRDAMAKQVWKGEAIPAALYPQIPGTLGYDDSLKPYPYDPAKAKELLAQAGYPNGFDIKFFNIALASAPGMSDAAQAVATFWRQIGVRATLEPIDITKWTDLSRPRKVSGYASNIGRAWKLPESLYYLNVHFSEGGAIGGAEYPELEGLRKQAEAELDDAKRAQLLKQAGRFVYDNYLVVPMVYANMLFGMSPKIAEWPTTQGMLTIHSLEYVKAK